MCVADLKAVTLSALLIGLAACESGMSEQSLQAEPGAIEAHLLLPTALPLPPPPISQQLAPRLFTPKGG
jgi:hypothetical protein